jgi:hypothetical protein
VRVFLISAFVMSLAAGAYAQQPAPQTAQNGGGRTCSGLASRCEASCGSASKHALCSNQCQQRQSQCMATGVYTQADGHAINNVARQ